MTCHMGPREPLTLYSPLLPCHHLSLQSPSSRIQGPRGPQHTSSREQPCAQSLANLAMEERNRGDGGSVLGSLEQRPAGERGRVTQGQMAKLTQQSASCGLNKL